mmetsp:Transcript_40515/g.111520  ORF Transcript_40515/g.111520 Transcript_40515/m.111520 type:complete len:207 (+) Transcript_40515:163-783(+)
MGTGNATNAAALRAPGNAARTAVAALRRELDHGVIPRQLLRPIRRAPFVLLRQLQQRVHIARVLLDLLLQSVPPASLLLEPPRSLVEQLTAMLELSVLRVELGLNVNHAQPHFLLLSKHLAAVLLEVPHPRVDCTHHLLSLLHTVEGAWCALDMALRERLHGHVRWEATGAGGHARQGPRRSTWREPPPRLAAPPHPRPASRPPRR